MTNFGETYHHTNQGKNSMDCDITLEMIDAYLLEACKTAEYCATNVSGDVTEYIVRIGERVYVFIIPE